MREGPPTRRLGRTVPAAAAGERLDRLAEAWIAEALGRPVSRAAIRRLVMAGAVRVEGRPLRRPGVALPEGARVEILVDPRRLGPPDAERDAARRFGPERFLYRDSFLLAVDKPAGLAMHASADATRPNLYDVVKSLLRATGGPEPHLGIHQRLDRDTSGVVLFTLDPSANAPLAQAFTAARVAKTYHALCARPQRAPPARWRVTGPLGGDGPLADTSFRIVGTLPGALLVEARPSTGRKHQIRIHLAQGGLPILGDRRYGGPPAAGVTRVMLHALRLELAHPVTGSPLRIESPYPADFQSVVTRPGPRARSRRAAVRIPRGRAR